MTWRCPACTTVINHSPLEPQPRPGVRYRCHVCRLTLEYQPSDDKLLVTSLDAERVHAVDPNAAVVRPEYPPPAPEKPAPKRRRK